MAGKKIPKLVIKGSTASKKKLEKEFKEFMALGNSYVNASEIAKINMQLQELNRINVEHIKKINKGTSFTTPCF